MVDPNEQGDVAETAVAWKKLGIRSLTALKTLYGLTSRCDIFFN